MQNIWNQYFHQSHFQIIIQSSLAYTLNHMALFLIDSSTRKRMKHFHTPIATLLNNQNGGLVNQSGYFGENDELINNIK